MILDTGGCIDEKRDIAKYKNPGQSLLVVGSISIVPVMKEFTPEETKECLKGASITIGYIPDGSHTCDYAIFNVYANGVEIGVANLNNGPLDTEGKITDYTKNRKSELNPLMDKDTLPFLLFSAISDICLSSKTNSADLLPPFSPSDFLFLV